MLLFLDSPVDTSGETEEELLSPVWLVGLRTRRLIKLQEMAPGPGPSSSRRSSSSGASG